MPRPAISLALFLPLLALPAHATDAPDAWTGLWNECYDVHTIGFDERLDSFQKLITLGRSWQKDVARDEALIDDVTDHTCKAWAASPNSDTLLKEFTTKYGDASALALSLEDEADNYLLANLEKWNQSQEEEVRNLESWPSGEKNLRWQTHFPCSGAFTRAVTQIREETRSLREHLSRLEKECPHAADSAIRSAAEERALRAQGGSSDPAKAPSGHPAGSTSDITGTEKKSPGLE